MAEGISLNDELVSAFIPISTDADIVIARKLSRELATVIGFSGTDLTIIATAVSEIARNILEYAKTGEIKIRKSTREGKKGIQIIASDRGPGIPDIFRAMQDGYSTSNGLGLGLSGSMRLMDDFNIVSESGKGTTVTMTKWQT